MWLGFLQKLQVHFFDCTVKSLLIIHRQSCLSTVTSISSKSCRLASRCMTSSFLETETSQGQIYSSTYTLEMTLQLVFSGLNLYWILRFNILIRYSKFSSPDNTIWFPVHYTVCSFRYHKLSSANWLCTFNVFTHCMGRTVAASTVDSHHHGNRLFRHPERVAWGHLIQFPRWPKSRIPDHFII